MEAAQLTTTRLHDEDAGLEATFVPGAGMLCSSLRYRGEELLAQNAGLAAYAEHGKTMGIPLLYPWANRLAGFEYSAAGRTVQIPHDPSLIALDGNGLPIHGVIGGRQAWELTRAPGLDATPGSEAAPGSDATPDRETRSLQARLSWSEEQAQLFEVFPFHHDLRYGARLAGGRLEIEVTVHACGADVVPLAFGFHPYLAPKGVPRKRWQIELPAMRSLKLGGNQIPVGAAEQVAPSQRFELGEQEFDDGFDSLAESARFAVAAGRQKLELEFRWGYRCAQVYAPLGGQFICFEPMVAPANALRSGTGLFLLRPGERYRAGFSLQVEDLAGSGVD
jgi:aldose 1-epimerase